MGDRLSIIVRTYNSAATLEDCLRSLAGQTVRPEVIVVDSGSTDDTLTIAHRYADRFTTLPHEAFTYGRALNRGAEIASAPIHGALSSHCTLNSRTWVADALRHYERAEVAAACGHIVGPDGSPLVAPLDVTAETPIPNPRWSFSNHASTWRVSVWGEHPFNETLPASEDTEWADHAVSKGHTIVFDPALLVVGHHRDAHGLRDVYRRAQRETTGLAAVRNVAPLTARELLRSWAADRFRPNRAAELVGRWRSTT